MGVFVADLAKQYRIAVTVLTRKPSADYGEGRYAFDLTTSEGKHVEVQMPGGPLERIRGGWTRVYVDGSSWYWDYALANCREEDWGDEREAVDTGDDRTEPQVIHCYLYAHVARSNPVAIERQVQECHTLAKSLSSAATEYRVVRMFQDDGGSGLSADRPAYRELLAELEEGEVATVLVFSTEQLHRSTALQHAYKELSNRLGITTFSVQSSRTA